MDGCSATIIDWLVRLHNICFVSMTPVDWVTVCMVPLCKGKGDKCDCTSFRVISLLNIVGKACGKLLVKRIREGTEGVICDDQSGFRRATSCLNLMFGVRQVCKNCLAIIADVFWGFMEKRWAVQRLYGLVLYY